MMIVLFFLGTALGALAVVAASLVTAVAALRTLRERLALQDRLELADAFVGLRTKAVRHHSTALPARPLRPANPERVRQHVAA